MALKKILSALMAAVLLAACGNSDEFIVEGKIEGAPSINLYLKYYGSNAVVSGVTLANDGNFQFKGYSKTPTLVEISDNEGNILGVFVAKGGDKLQVSLDRSNPYLIDVRGSELNEEWSKFCRANASVLHTGSSEEINGVVEEYIASHNDNEAAALAFALCYDSSLSPLRSDSVALTIAPEAKGRYFDTYVMMIDRLVDPKSYAHVDTIRYRTVKRDSVEYFLAKKHKISLIAFTKDYKDRRDSLAIRLGKLSKKKNLYVLDMSLSSDTDVWKRNVLFDSATWTQGWAPGGLFASDVEKLALPRIPYYIVVDSVGVQRFRGSDLKEVENFISAQSL